MISKKPSKEIKKAPSKIFWMNPCLQPIPWAFGPITIQSMDDLDRRQGRYLENFMFIPQLEVCQERGGQEGRYLEDIGGSWLETWRTGSFLTSWIMFFYSKEDTLKIWWWYINWKSVRKGVSGRGVLKGCWGFMTGDLDDRVIPDIINDVILPLEI